jgi:hypothetical protein
MTGFESKRQAAQAKVQEEMQVIFTQRQAERDKLQDEPDTLLIVYQRGFADGKAAQRPWVGLTDEDKKKIATAAGCTEDDDGHIVTEIFRLAEAKLRSKNGH